MKDTIDAMSLSGDCPRKYIAGPLCLHYIKVSTDIIILGIDLAYYIIYQADDRAAVTQNYLHYQNCAMPFHGTTYFGSLALFKVFHRR